MTTNLDFFLSVAQVQLLQQLVQANMVGLEPSSSTTEVGFFSGLKLCFLEYSNSDQVFASSRQNYTYFIYLHIIVTFLVSFKMHSNFVLAIECVILTRILFSKLD